MAIVLALGAIGCGDTDAETTAVATSDLGSSAYCKAAQRWAVREMDPVDDSDPASFKSYWTDYIAFAREARRTAPSGIDAAWETYGTAVVGMLIPVLEKYGYDLDAIRTKGSPAEQKLIGAPPEGKIGDAFTSILTYESAVCGSQQPPPAEVSFASETPGEYCEIAGRMHQLFDDVQASGLEPADVRKLLTGAELETLGRRSVSSAPAAIRGDVTKLERFDRERQIPVLAKYGYDFRRLMLDGTSTDRAVVNHAVPSIRTASARIDAYTDQVCSR